MPNIKLNYQSTRDHPPRWWRKYIHPIAIAISLLVCLVPSGLAVLAWIAHFEWLRTGAYARNSFPMRSFAVDMTWLSVICTTVVSFAWLLVIVLLRRRKQD